ncbi:hypothetical protein SAMN05443247_11578 [Bradyrhizobium erythrophlei]|jgi:hypothetical protein|nr:hypothetical protein SAMN05443247_11578 [Bradyrhizobium erythrophlei]
MATPHEPEPLGLPRNGGQYPGQSGHHTGNDDIVGDDGDDHPIPACRIVAVTLPPALDSAFIVSRIAATGAALVPSVMNWLLLPASSMKPVGAELFGDIHHASRFNLRRPQCGSFRSGLTRLPLGRMPVWRHAFAAIKAAMLLGSPIPMIAE